MCRNTWKFPQRRCSFTFCTQRLSTFYPFSSKPTGYTGSKWQSYITQIYFMLFHTTVILLEIAFLCEILVLYLWLCYAHAGEVKNHQPTLRSRWTASPRCPGCQWVAKQHDDSIVFSWLMKLWTSGHLVIPEHVRKKNISRDVPENAGRCNSSGRKRASATVSRLPHFGIVPKRSNRPVCQVFLKGQLSSLGASVPMHLLRKGRKTAGSSPEQVAWEFSKWEYFEL